MSNRYREPANTDSVTIGGRGSVWYEVLQYSLPGLPADQNLFRADMCVLFTHTCNKSTYTANQIADCVWSNMMRVFLTPLDPCFPTFVHPNMATQENNYLNRKLPYTCKKVRLKYGCE